MVRVTLGEGGTPLVPSSRLGASLGLSRLFFKLEICNPSGSYKDRFVRAEMARMLRLGTRACVATSSGNTGSSLAAYCARYGITCAILVNQQVPAGKLEQMQAHGARVFRVRDFTTSPTVTQNIFRRLSKLAGERALPLVVSAYRYCPEGMAGVEPIAGELLEQCASGIDHVFVPVGGGGLFTAVCRGFRKQSASKPRVHAVQLEGCSTVVAAFKRQDSEIRPVESTTRISGLAVPFDIDGSLALEHLHSAGGRGFDQEGIYSEPAGAAALAGLRRALSDGTVRRDDTVICLVTGHGFKDPDSVRRVATRHAPALIEEVQLENSLSEIIPSCV